MCQFRPPQNEINLFDWHGLEIQDGLSKLSEDIEEYNPHICVLLGNTPLTGGCLVLNTKSQSGAGHYSFQISSVHFTTANVSASLHPAFVLREFSGFPLLKFDLTRALSEGTDPSLKLPHRELITDLDADRMCYILDNWPTGRRCSVDIEGSLSRRLAMRVSFWFSDQVVLYRVESVR